MRKVYRSILALVLSLVMVLGMIAISAAMQPEFYAVWIVDTQVSSANADDVLGDGTVCYDAASKTLTLKNANIKSEGDFTRTLHANEDLTINLIGANSVVNVGYIEGSPAVSVYGDLEINADTPEASLTAISSSDDGISAETVTINGGKVYASGTDILSNDNGDDYPSGAGIAAGTAVTITGGEVTAEGNYAGIRSFYRFTVIGGRAKETGGEYGIFSDGDVIITGGEVTAESGEGKGISSSEFSNTSCNLTISNAVVTVVGGLNGLDGYDVAISNAVVTAVGGLNGLDGYETVAISDSEVTASGGENGLYTDTAITIDNSTVKAYGETLHGIVAPSISISDATVETEGCSTGIFAFDDNCSVVISNSTVTAKASDAEGTAIDAIFGTLTIEDNAKVIAGCRKGLCADKINILKNSTVEIDAALYAIYFCDELNFGNNWYKWSIDGGKSFKDSSEMPLKVEEASETMTLLIEPNGKYPTISKPTNIHGVPSFGSAEQPLESPKTFDGGIALPISMAILAATGGAWLAKKKD